MSKYHVFFADGEERVFPISASEGINTSYLGEADSLEEASNLIEKAQIVYLDDLDDFACDSFFVRQITKYCYLALHCRSKASQVNNPMFGFDGWFLITEKDSITEDDFPIDFGYYREARRKSREEKIPLDFWEEIRWRKN